jgi:hypothetical protein
MMIEIQRNSWRSEVDEAFVSFALPSFALRDGNPMRLFATHVSGRIKLFATVPDEATPPDDGILELEVRPEIPCFPRSFAYLYLTFERGGVPVDLKVPGVNYEVWLDRDEVLPCAA